MSSLAYSFLFNLTALPCFKQEYLFNCVPVFCMSVTTLHTEPYSFEICLSACWTQKKLWCTANFLHHASLQFEIFSILTFGLHGCNFNALLFIYSCMFFRSKLHATEYWHGFSVWKQTTGSLYFWAAHLAGPVWGPLASWCCAWLEAIGLIAGIGTQVHFSVCIADLIKCSRFFYSSLPLFWGDISIWPLLRNNKDY